MAARQEGYAVKCKCTGEGGSGPNSGAVEGRHKGADQRALGQLDGLAVA